MEAWRHGGVEARLVQLPTLNPPADQCRFSSRVISPHRKCEPVPNCRVLFVLREVPTNEPLPSSEPANIL